jgi:NADPH:quinone reductase-like Zn-dependent oxidoreductase
MATAVVARAYGGPEVLALVEVPVGQPGPGQALIEVRAAGVNPVDYKIYAGVYGSDPSSLPMRLGYEASGVVQAVGEGAEGPGGPLHPGDEVIAYPVQGAYATELVAPASSMLAKPAGLSFAQASGLMLTGVTAAHAIHATDVGVSDTVVVHGAAGGVGLMVVQLAVNARARVIGTANEDNHDLLRRLGAEPVSYGDGLLERLRALAPDGVDAAIDCVGTDEALDTSLALVADRGRVATIVAFKRGTEAGVKVLGMGPGGDPGTELRAAARVDLQRLAEKGMLKVVMATTYPLSEVAAAHRALATGHTRGKIALRPLETMPSL